MSQTAMKLTLICELSIEKEIENAFINSGIEFRREDIKEPIEAHIFYIPNAIWALSVALHILEARKDVVNGNLELSDGKKYELTQEGREQLNKLLVEAMWVERKETTMTQVTWWTPFIPEIREGLRAIIELMKWYPKATGEGKKTVVTYFVVLIGLIVLGMGILTYYDKVSGDAFVFVIGALIGYVFAFLQRFLGILGD